MFLLLPERLGEVLYLCSHDKECFFLLWLSRQYKDFTRRWISKWFTYLEGFSVTGSAGVLVTLRDVIALPTKEAPTKEKAPNDCSDGALEC